MQVVYVYVGGDDDGGITEPPTSSTKEADAELDVVYVYLSNDDDSGDATDPPTNNEDLSIEADSTSDADIAATGLDASTESPESNVTLFDFDRSKFVAVEQLPTIGFHITVDEITKLNKKRKLKVYLQSFLKDVLDMGSNQDWYPFHSKSIGKITTELLPVWNLSLIHI